jgi:hypothetical protein
MYAMISIVRNFTEMKERKEEIKLNSDLLFKIICNIMQQLVEKIDRVRLVAGSVLQDYFDNLQDKTPDFPYKKSLIEIFNINNINKTIKED